MKRYKNVINIALISLITSSILFASEKISIPLPAESLSVENSGLKQPIDAYQDGVGIYTMEALGANKVDNSEMNALVFKYGEAAKELNISVKEYVQTNGTNSEKELASTVGKFEPMVPGNGTVCNDNNAQTINDIYTNGVCSGTNVEGQNCDDGLAYTINDIYTNGLCTGTNIEGQSCDDGNIQTINDKYNSSGLCVGVNVEGQSCNDNNSLTVNDYYHNGICQGNVAQTCKDLYNSGVRTSGNYTIDLDGEGSLYDARTAYCYMGSLDGVSYGWTALYSFSSGPDTNKTAYFGSNINTTTELTNANISYYLTHINDSASYSYTVKSNSMSFYNAGSPYGYISFKVTGYTGKMYIGWANWYAGTTSLFKNNVLQRQLPGYKGDDSIALTYNSNDTIKIQEDGIVNVGIVYIY